ncbi:MAG: MerR family DNA-binding transcriptional regulator [Pirellula sp.]|nr:MerR family DNA-binding transcriptional regulator [Pirellula sp.]
MTKLNEYVQIAEAAEIVGVSQNTLRAWAEQGKIPMHRNPANGYRLFRQTDLDRFLQKTARAVKPSRNKKAK